MALVGREPLTRSGDNVCSGFVSLLNGNFHDVSASIVDALLQCYVVLLLFDHRAVSDALQCWHSQVRRGQTAASKNQQSASPEQPIKVKFR